MRVLFDGYNYVIRLDKGERLRAGLQLFFEQSDIGGGWLSGIGGAQEVELGFYDLTKHEYRWRTMKQLVEIVSLQGAIARDQHGDLTAHLHGSFADIDNQVVGGHVKDLVVGGTCEIFVHRTFQPLGRRYDDGAGLDLLDV